MAKKDSNKSPMLESKIFWKADNLRGEELKITTLKVSPLDAELLTAEPTTEEELAKILEHKDSSFLLYLQKVVTIGFCLLWILLFSFVVWFLFSEDLEKVTIFYNLRRFYEF